MLAGSIGVTALAAAAPTLMREYATVGADQVVTATAVGLLIEVVFRGIWQTLDPILLGFWFVVVGRLARRRQPAWGSLSTTLRVLLGLGIVTNVLGLGLALDGLAGVVFVLGLAWVIALGLLLMRRAAL